MEQEFGLLGSLRVNGALDEIKINEYALGEEAFCIDADNDQTYTVPLPTDEEMKVPSMCRNCLQPAVAKPEVDIICSFCHRQKLCFSCKGLGLRLIHEEIFLSPG